MLGNVVHRRSSVRIGILLASTALVSAQQCPRVVERAVTAVDARAAQLLDQTGAAGWRVHLHPQVIEAGSVVAPFSLTGRGIPAQHLTCPGRCLLFFVDTMPLHHFAHPTLIALYDLDGREVLGPLQAEWWPTVDGRSIFHTVADRRRREWIVRERGAVPPIPRDPPSWTAHGMLLKSALPAPAARVWAVLVNGYHDSSDTFDEDTLGMYSVLRGIGVPDGNITFLSPLDHSSQGIATTPVSVQALEQALDSVGQPCDELLLFYSAHGITNNLACGTDPNRAVNPGSIAQQDYVAANELKEMLEDLDRCSAVTVVIEACKSGSILKHFRDDAPPLRSDAGDGPWQMYVSASELAQSAGDVDTATDTNVADAGSETIWGYVEAFGTRAADTDDNGWVDFKEAVDYATTADATGGNHTGVAYVSKPPGTPVPGQPAHGSDLVAWGGQPVVAFESPCAAGQAPGSTPCPNQVTRCCAAALTLTVRNSSTQSLSMPFALRLFRPDPSSSWTPAYSPGDNLRTTVMLPGLPGGGQLKVALDLGVVPTSFSSGDTITVQTTIDHLEKMSAIGPVPPLSGVAKDEMKLEVTQCLMDACCWLSGSLCP